MSEPQPLSRRKLLKRGFAFGSLALGVDAFGVEPNWFDVERIEIPINGLGRSFDGYRISLFSDIHWPRNINKGHVHRAVDLANSFDPDLVAIPGDLCDVKGVSDGAVPDLSGLYDGLKSRDGILSTLGNHDYSFNVHKLRAEVARNTPLEDIEDRYRVIRRGRDSLAVGGVQDLFYGIPDPVGAFAGLSPSIPRIMLSHNPDVAEDVVWPTRIDLQLSGHTHGGEVRIPLADAPFIPSKYGQKFLSGLVQGRSHRVYVTRGICSCRHVRFFCRPEVTHITLRSA